MSRYGDIEERLTLEQIILNQVAKCLDAFTLATVYGRPRIAWNEVDGLIHLLLPYSENDGQFRKKLRELNQTFLKDERNARAKFMRADLYRYARMKFDVCMAFIDDIKLGLTKKKKEWWSKEDERSEIMEPEDKT